MTGAAAKLPVAYAEEHRLRTELEKARANLEREVAARRRLERAILEVTDNERQRLARMLHETLCQSVGGIGLLARVIRRKLDSTGGTEMADAEELGKAINAASRELHTIMGWLRPAAVDGEDVAAALADMAPLISQGIPCEFQCPEPVALTNPLAAEQLIQIAYEAVNDALKRPGIQRVTISLTARDRCVTLMVRGDGEPAEGPQAAEFHAGRELMRLRADSLGARLTILSRTEGTSIICKLPHSN